MMCAQCKQLPNVSCLCAADHAAGGGSDGEHSLATAGPVVDLGIRRDIAALVSARMAALDLTPNQLAARAGVSRHTVRAVVGGWERDFKLVSLRRLSEGLGWPPQTLLRLFADPDLPLAG